MNKFPETYRVLGADLSLRRPGWCLLKVDKGKITIEKLFSLDNKTKKNKTHGQILREITELFINEIVSKLSDISPCYFVREKMVMHVKVPSERDVAKVVGIMDMLNDNEWEEIYPVTIKKLITGSGKADKSQVAECLECYVGKQNYKCDDESDATATAVAWLIQQEQIKGLY